MFSTGQCRTGQWTRSHIFHINACSHTCSLRWWLAEGDVAKFSVRVVTGLRVLVTAVLFPDGKRLFSTQIVETSSGLQTALYPTDGRVFSEKLMVVHLRMKFLFHTKRSSALKYLNSVQPLKPCSLKTHFDIVLISIPSPTVFAPEIFSIFRELTYMLRISPLLKIFRTMTNKCTILSQIIILLHMWK